MPKEEEFERVKLEKTLEYCKYLYEEEKERRDNLNNTTRIYLAAFTLAVGIGIVKVGNVDRFAGLVDKLSKSGEFSLAHILIVNSVLGISIVSMIASFIFTILVVRIWRWERLTEPRDFVSDTKNVTANEKILSLMIADHVVATERNHLINERKAALLSKGLNSFLIGLVLFLITIFYLSIIFSEVNHI